jgi:hypothetical protein
VFKTLQKPPFFGEVFRLISSIAVLFYG